MTSNQPLPLWKKWVPLAALTVFVIWLANPYLSGRMIGGGDALWYHAQIADAVTQARAGVFPVWIGQTEFAFNGAVHPFRSAPLLHNVACLIDVVTGRSLTVASIVGGIVFVTLLLAAWSCYGALLWFSPGDRARAALLAGIYVACPGVVGLVYAQDLYMSSLAIPFLPWVLASALQLGRGETATAPWVFGGALGALWWAHAPIALWATLAVTLLQAGIAVSAIRDRQLVGLWVSEIIRAALAFALVAAFPLISVFTLREAGQSVVTVTMDREGILREISQLLPWIFLPLRLDAPLLAYLQPGYAVLALLGACLLRASTGAVFGRFRVWLGLACSGFLLLFIISIPGVTRALWNVLPEFWLGITNYWPNQRVVPILAALVIILFRESGRHRREPKWTFSLWVILILWGGYQAYAIRGTAVRHMRSLDETVLAALPENSAVSAYSYQQLPQRPAYFIHGVTDPEMEIRWISRAGVTGASSNRAVVESKATSEWQRLTLLPAANPGILVSTQRFTLNPGERYLLTFEFGERAPKGILRLMGQTLSRAYVLPEAGDALAFGHGVGRDKSIPVHSTSAAGPETFHVEFIPQLAPGETFDAKTFARVRLTRIDRATLPVRVESLTPMRLQVASLGPIELETPRVYFPGWRAELNGKEIPVKRSAQGLLSMALPTGGGEVVVSYVGSPALRYSYWISLAAIVVFAGFLGGCAWRAQRIEPHDPEPQLAAR